MYSIEKHKKAVGLYIKYDKCTAEMIHELGYPDRKTLTRWYKNMQRPVCTGKGIHGADIQNTLWGKRKQQ